MELKLFGFSTIPDLAGTKKGERLHPHLLLTENITRLINVAVSNSYY
jgi:hypothetical protein